MILAELEVFHSRPIAPTRRLALGRSMLPVDPAPGFGGVLLGGIVAAHIAELDLDLLGDLHRLTFQLEHGQRVPQPRLRHRFQSDRVGLRRSHHRLVGDGERLAFDLEDHGAPTQQILAAVYAAGRLRREARTPVMMTIRKAIRWQGPVGPALVSYLAGVGGAASWSAAAFEDPVRWALGVLQFTNGHDEPEAGRPRRTDVQRRFRELVRDAHPDHGAESVGAAQRIRDLSEARRILLG